MTTEHEKVLGELADNALDGVAGGGGEWGVYSLPPTGFGARTDFMIAQKQILESNYRGALVVPKLP
jgi:hypothetical protein